MRESAATLLRLLGVSLALALPLAIGEIFLRARFAETPYMPGAQMRAVQDRLAAHPDLGFLWKPDIAVADGVLLPWADQVVEPLSTDAQGFRNAPGAIAWRREGRPVDVVGLGDSFVHDAAYTFYALFAEHGLFYYNLAMHRHSPPQYNRILAEYAVPLWPRQAVYGLFENDFREARDFEAWRASGLDWFTYHSGLWAGPPRATGRGARFARRYLPGSYGLYRSLTRERRRRREAAWLAAEAPTALAAYVREAAVLAREHDIGLLVVLIPSRHTVLKGPTPEAGAMAALRDELGAAGIAVVDLRERFARAPDPASLYYRVDAHWNARGIRLAGQAILEALAAPGEADQGPPPDSAAGAPSKGPRGAARRRALAARAGSPSRS